MIFECKFKINDKVSISDKTISFINPFIKEYVKFKTGIIRKVYPPCSTCPECLYEIQFNDGRIATEVFESYIRNSISIVRDTEYSPGSYVTSCKFKINDKVSISDKTITFINPTRIEYVDLKAGFIRRLLPPSSYGCLYEIQFNDGKIATEVKESYIRKSVSIVRDHEYSTSSGTVTTDSDTQTDNLYSPFSLKQPDSKMDMITLIALNNFNESIKQSLKPNQNLYNQNLYNQNLYNQNLNIPLFTQESQNIGNDENLQNDVTEYYQKKTIKWIKNEYEFSKAKKQMNFVKSNKGLQYLKKILLFYVKKNNKNWYELRDKETKYDIQELIRLKLISL